MPIYRYTVPNLPTILRICFKEDVSPTTVAKKQQIRGNETMIFILNQSQVDIKHPLDLDADQIGGAFTNNVKVGFYECEFDDEGDLTYNEVQVKKDSDVKVDINVNPRIWICEFTKRENVGGKSGRYGKGCCSYMQTVQTQSNKTQSRRKIHQEQHICHGFGRVLRQLCFAKSPIHDYLIHGQHVC